MSIRGPLERRLVEGSENRAFFTERTLMANAQLKDAWKEQLWNVSLLPIVQVSQGAPPPAGPAPGGGTALKTPATLSLTDDARGVPSARAA
jgi:hypothetical protein